MDLGLNPFQPPVLVNDADQLAVTLLVRPAVPLTKDVSTLFVYSKSRCSDPSFVRNRRQTALAINHVVGQGIVGFSLDGLTPLWSASSGRGWSGEYNSQETSPNPSPSVLEPGYVNWVFDTQ